MAGLEINLKPIEGQNLAALAEMSGAIDGTTVVSFQDALEDIKKKGIRKLILDMSKVKYVNSTGLGSLVKYADAFKSSGGGMALIKVPAKVKIVIEMLGLHAFFEICADMKSALQALLAKGAAAAPAPPGPPPPGPRPMPAPQPHMRTATPQPGPRPQPPGPGPAPAPRPPSVAPAPVATTTSGAVNFPFAAACQSCQVMIEFPSFGNFRCPRCFTIVSLKNDGSMRFLRQQDRGHAVQLSLTSTAECAEGLAQFAVAMCHGHLNGGGPEAVRQAIAEVCRVIAQAVYPQSPTSVYHVTIERRAQDMLIRFSDHGNAIDATQIDQFFPTARRAMEQFDCRPHPKGGNIIQMAKRR